MRLLVSYKSILGRRALIVPYVLILLTLLYATAAAENAVRLLCPATANLSPSDSVGLKVLLSNDIPLNGISLGFRCKSDKFEISSATAEAALQLPVAYGEFLCQILPATNQVAVGWLNYENEIPLPANATPVEAFTIWLRASPAYAGQCVDIDSGYVAGGHFWYFLYQDGLVQLSPAYHDCGSCDIVGNSVACGDANASGRIDITDVVCIINYIFASGPAPLDCGGGDFDCNGRTAITDAVFLIRYIFAGGESPCAGCK